MNKTVGFFLLTLFLFSSVCLNGVEINEKWVQNKKIMRKLHLEKGSINELDKLDELTIKDLNRNPFNEIEKEVADLLRFIVIEKTYTSPTNTADAITVLYTKFENKQYFFDLIYSIAGYKFMSNHYILSTVLIGFSQNMTVDPDKLFLTLDIMKDSIDVYIYDPQRNGTRIIIANLVAFIRKYIEVAATDNLDSKYDKVVGHFIQNLGFDAKSSSFDNYEGAKDLKMEYFMYNEDKKKK